MIKQIIRLFRPKPESFGRLDRQNITSLLAVYFILLMTFLAGIFVGPEQVTVPLAVASPILLAGFFVTRNLNYKAGGLLLISILYATDIIILFFFDAQGLFGCLYFTWVLVTVFIAALFFNTKMVVVMAVVENLYIILIYYLNPKIDFLAFKSWLFFNFFFCMVSIIIRIIIDYYRNELIFQNKKLEIEVRRRTRRLEQNLEEKDILIRELYHRTNNNLQLVSSLLHLRLDPLMSNNNEKTTLLKTYSQLDAMALVHNRLYASKDLRFISLKDYLNDIQERLNDILKADRNSFYLIIRAEDLKMPLELSIPLGLIINEILINVYLYYSDAGKDVVVITINALSKQDKELIVNISCEDELLPVRVKPQDLFNDSVDFIRLLAVKQLKGSIDYKTADQYFSIEIRIPLEDFDFNERQHTHSDF